MRIFPMEVKTPAGPSRCHGYHGYQFVRGAWCSSLHLAGGFHSKTDPSCNKLEVIAGIGGTSLGFLGRFRRLKTHIPTGYKLNIEKEREAGETELLQLNVSVIIVIASSLLVWLLGVVATDESGNWLIVADQSLHAYMSDQTTGSDHLFFNDVSNKLDDLMQYSSWLVALLNLLSFNQEGTLLFLTVPGGLQIVRFCQKMLKAGFHRIRPSGMVSDFSYPSAHTARFAFCASLILLVLLPQFTGRERRTTLDQWFLTALAAVILMGSCRMLADAHWFSDTVGGAALGVDVAAAVEICVLLLQNAMRQAASSGKNRSFWGSAVRGFWRHAPLTPGEKEAEAVEALGAQLCLKTGSEHCSCDMEAGLGGPKFRHS